MEIVDKAKRKRDVVSNIVPFEFKKEGDKSKPISKKKIDTESKKEISFATKLNEDTSPIPYITKWDDLVNALIFWFEHPKTKWSFNGYFRHNLDEGTGFVNTMEDFEKKQLMERENEEKKFFLGSMIKFIKKYRAITLDSQPGIDFQVEPISAKFQKDLEAFIASNGQPELFEDEGEEVNKNFLKYIKKKFKENPKFQYTYTQIQMPYLNFMVPREIGLKMLAALKNQSEISWTDFDLKTKKGDSNMDSDITVSYTIFPSEPEPISPDSDNTYIHDESTMENVEANLLPTTEKWTPDILQYAFNETIFFSATTKNQYSTAKFFEQLGLLRKLRVGK
jgi:hypothetical protein